MILQQSESDLCTITRDNLKLCNEISDYCHNYQIEYSEEKKELEDLMLYFKKYIDKF
jgi:hypothetical protein